MNEARTYAFAVVIGIAIGVGFVSLYLFKDTILGTGSIPSGPGEHFEGGTRFVERLSEEVEL